MIRMTNNDKTNFLIYRLARAESERLRLSLVDAKESSEAVINHIAVGSMAKSIKYSPFEDGEMNKVMFEFLQSIESAQDTFKSKFDEIHAKHEKRREDTEKLIDGLSNLLYKQGVTVQNVRLFLPLIGETTSFENSANMYKHLSRNVDSNEFTIESMQDNGVYIACPNTSSAVNKLNMHIMDAAKELRVSVGGVEKIDRANIKFEHNDDEFIENYIHPDDEEMKNERSLMEVAQFTSKADSKYLIQYNKISNFGENIPSL